MRDTGLGMLRGQRCAGAHARRPGGLDHAASLRAFFDEPKTLIVTKANVSRACTGASISITSASSASTPTAIRSARFRIVGLFTSTVYTRSTRSIPYLRRKVDAVLTRAGFDPDGHSGKALVNVLETYPRDELFQIDEDTLYRFALSILQLEERPRVRVLARRDRFDRFVSVLVYVPRERYSGQVRAQIGEYLAEVFDGHVSAYYPYIHDAPLTRVHFIIGRRTGPTPDPDRATLEDKVSAHRAHLDRWLCRRACAAPTSRPRRARC